MTQDCPGAGARCGASKTTCARPSPSRVTVAGASGARERTFTSTGADVCSALSQGLGSVLFRVNLLDKDRIPQRHAQMLALPDSVVQKALVPAADLPVR